MILEIFSTGAKVILSPQEGPGERGTGRRQDGVDFEKEGRGPEPRSADSSEAGKRKPKTESPHRAFRKEHSPCRQLHLRPVRLEPDCHLQNHGRTKRTVWGPEPCICHSSTREYASSLGTREMEPEYQSHTLPTQAVNTQKGAQRTCDWLTGVLGDKGDCPALRV